MLYVTNSFSLGMLEGSARIHCMEVSQESAAFLLRCEGSDWESAIGHADTSELVSAMLGQRVEMNRRSIVFGEDDELLVAQYTGPRLPEGATSLPEGASIRWFHVRHMIPTTMNAWY